MFSRDDDAPNQYAAGALEPDVQYGALRCSTCNGKPMPVYVVTGPTRQALYGPPPSWPVEITGVPLPSKLEA
jgi:hypothetical protein